MRRYAPLLQRRVVIEDLVARRVVAEHEPEVLGRLRLLVEVRAHDRRHAGCEIREQLVPARLHVLARPRGRRAEPHGPRAKAEPLERGLQLLGRRAHTARRIHSAQREHLVLIDRVAERAQVHLGRGLAAEVALLQHVRHAFDQHAPGGRRRALRGVRAARGDEQPHEGPKAAPTYPDFASRSSLVRRRAQKFHTA